MGYYDNYDNNNYNYYQFKEKEYLEQLIQSCYF